MASFGFADGEKFILPTKSLVSGWEISGEEPIPLHEAVAMGNLKEVKKLVREGADINAVTMNMFTPLHVAVMENQYEIAKFLLTHGANVNAIGENGESLETPLHLSVGRDGNIEMAKLLLRHGGNANALNSHKATPLHHAVGLGNLDMVQLLLKGGADSNIQDIFGATSLHHAAYLFVKGYPNRLTIVNLLIKHGADINKPDYEDKVPLDIAVESEDNEMVDLLIKYGAKK
ncbi:hypothetical protein NITGR_190006 [Nitrospina gracilis 3/211]|uniref:Uncharacterized protein n=2 Tax=Nitrospinaceae TaxID=407032 RepID=M1YW65_NITG3|nr:hypothetical protein NITGR_190006 [Nitrospina gracilis 3/211]